MTFRRGEPRPPGGGRKPGSPNRLTKVMKDEWLAAYEAEGGIEYLRRVAREEPGIFVRGLIRMIPNAVEVNGDLEATVLRVVDRSDSRRDDLAEEPREPSSDERVAAPSPVELRDVPRDLPPAAAPMPAPAAPTLFVRRFEDVQFEAEY